MSYRIGGDKKLLYLIVFLGVFLAIPTISLPLSTLTSTSDKITDEKSTTPNSNDSLVNTTLLVQINHTLILPYDIINVEIEVHLNITVFFNDNNSNPLHGANVELLGFGNMSEVLNQYNFTLNTNELGLGINSLTIFAQLDGYQPQTFQLFVDVVEKATNIQLFVNTEDKTADPVIELPVGAIINITVKFFSNRTGLEIPNALVQLIGEGIVENLTENSILKQYTIFLDSSYLSIGVRLFSILALAPNYKMNTIDLRITVERIRTEISGNSIIEILAGQIIHLEVELIDLDFGGSIIGATVTYIWQYGQGILTDLNSDGIYEANLISTTVGIYNLVITAFKGENYNFESFQITIIITNPLGVFILSSNADIPDLDGTFHLAWICLEHVDNYSIYVCNSFITKINNSVILLEDQTAISPYLISGLPNGIYYYVVVAFNEYGNSSSNCIQVIVLRTVDEVIIPGYDLFAFIGIMSIFSLIIVQKQLRHKNSGESHSHKNEKRKVK